MATVNVPTPKPEWLEVVADVLTVIIVGDIVWVNFFQQAPPFQPLHNIIAFLGTAAAMWLVFKMAKKNKAFG